MDLNVIDYVYKYKGVKFNIRTSQRCHHDIPMGKIEMVTLNESFRNWYKTHNRSSYVYTSRLAQPVQTIVGGATFNDYFLSKSQASQWKESKKFLEGLAREMTDIYLETLSEHERLALEAA